MNPCDKATANFEPLFAVFNYFLSARPSIYLSAPMNSGWKFITWYEEIGRSLRANPDRYSVGLSSTVVASNKERAAAVAASIREREIGVKVIDPTAFEFAMFLG